MLQQNQWIPRGKEDRWTEAEVKRRSRGCSLKRHEDACICFNALQIVSLKLQKVT